MIDIVKGISAVRDPTSVRRWALRVTATRAIKVARRERLLSRIHPLAEEAEPAAKGGEDRRSELKRAFDALPPRMRAVAVLRLYLGLSEQETAATLGCSLGTVKSQLHEARKRLAAALRAEEAAPATMPPPTPRGGR